MRLAILAPIFSLCFCLHALCADEPGFIITIATNQPNNREVAFVCRRPSGQPDYPPAIMVLFGGRNWPGEQTLSAYGFDNLADTFDLYLIAPSFTDDDYWHPEAWSGEALFAAIDRLCEQEGLDRPDLYYYGYSAGGQCANLFYFWKPERVRGVAWHACGVYPDSARLPTAAPMLITCGEQDEARFDLSYTIAQNLREQGGSVIFKNFTGGHELTPQVLALAVSFFTDLLSGKNQTVWVAEDFFLRLHAADTSAANAMDPTLCNPFLSRQTAELWLNPSASRDER